MKTVKPLTLGLLTRPYRYQGQNRLCIAALGFFRLGESSTHFLSEAEQWPKVMEQLPPATALDEIYGKPHGEMLVAGNAYAPEGRPTEQLHVRAKLGDVDKCLQVWGDRRWYYGPWYRITPPAAFTRMPLDFAHAYGGPNMADNPNGKGHTGNPLAGWLGQNEGDMPNVEYPRRPVRGHVRQRVPACFSPIDPSWPYRRRYSGTYDQTWLMHDAPGLASNLDPRFFQRAAADQWRNGAWQGNEPYRLENLHPQKPIIEGQLPNLAARAFVRRKANAQVDEIKMALDTVWLLPNALLGVALYHGEALVEDSDALDIDAVMIGYEPTHSPRSAEHYRSVLTLRTDPATAVLHALNESQLTPPVSAEVKAARTAKRAAANAGKLAARQAALDEAMAENWAKSGLTPPADYQAPKAELSPLEIDLNAISEGDLDLAEVLGHAQAMADNAEREGKAKLAAMEKEQAKLPAIAAPNSEIERAKLYARANTPAWDLVGGENPHVAELADLLTKAEQAGQPITPAQRREALDSLSKLPALQRKARRSAIQPSTPNLPADQAEWLGAHIRVWRLGNLPLAGRDLSAAALADIDFSHADLRETCFEQADLRGARFIGADLRGANFLGARLDGADFSQAQLDEANFCSCHASRTRFVGATMAKVMGMDGHFEQARFDGAVLTDAILTKGNFNQASLVGCTLDRTLMNDIRAAGSDWTSATLHASVLYRAQLVQANFRSASLTRVILLEATLDDSCWTTAQLDRCLLMTASAQRLNGQDMRCKGCNWRGVNWHAADLRHVRLRDCDLSDGQFSKARLDGGLFAGCLMGGVQLAGTDARDTNFLRALCRKADFRAANLHKANFRQAALDEAKFDDAVLDEAEFDPPVSRRLALQRKTA